MLRAQDWKERSFTYDIGRKIQSMEQKLDSNKMGGQLSNTISRDAKQQRRRRGAQLGSCDGFNEIISAIKI